MSSIGDELTRNWPSSSQLDVSQTWTNPSEHPVISRLLKGLFWLPSGTVLTPPHLTVSAIQLAGLFIAKYFIAVLNSVVIDIINTCAPIRESGNQICVY